MGRLVHQREFLAFKDDAEDKIIKLALNSKSTSEKLDQLIGEFSEFKNIVYTHMDATVNAIQGLKQEQTFTNQALKRIENRLDKVEEDIVVLKQDVAVLKQDVAVLKQDVAVLKQDVAELKVAVEKIENIINVILQKLEKIETKLT